MHVHTDDCMSEWAEARRDIMTPQTIECNHRLHMADSEEHTMDMRTRKQENKYGQALGYAWGRRDASNAREDLVLDSGAFATFYAMLEDLGGHHRPLQDAYAYFRKLRLEEQKAYGSEWMRRPWSMYEEMKYSREM